MWIRHLYIGLSAFSLCLMMVSVASANTGNFTIEESIKDIKPASGMCEVDIKAMDGAGYSYLNHSEIIEPDLSCAIDASQLATMIQNNQNLVLVDTRKASDFPKFNIAGAINTSVSDIKNKEHLKVKSIVLIGDGKAEREMYLSCAELKGMAFNDVRVLRGGMLSWVSNDYPIAGKAQADQLGLLSSLELWSESQFDENLIVIEGGQDQFRQELNTHYSVDNFSSSSLKKIIEKRSKQSKGRHFSSVIVVTDVSFSDDVLSQLRRDMFPIPVLIHSGTLDNYKQQLKQQKAVSAARDRGPKTPGCHL